MKRAADFLLSFQQDGNAAPWTPQERWENQSGYSPATIASEIAGLVCAAHIAEENGDAASAQGYLAVADAWQARVKDWTVTTTGPYSSGPYFLRLTKDGNPNAGTTYNIGDSGPSNVDQRRVGEYQIAAGDVEAGRDQLATIARTAGPGYMLPEQVWDLQPPAGTNGFVPGTPTFSATPLAWTHAQYLRLAWDARAGAVLEQPDIVAQRYAASPDSGD